MAEDCPVYLKEAGWHGVCSAGWEKNSDTVDSLNSFGVTFAPAQEC